MNDRAFNTGEIFLFDLYEVYEDLRSQIAQELGTAPFAAVVESLVDDALIYIFHGNQSTGERAIEAKLKKRFIEPVQAILITRKLFDQLYACMNLRGQGQLIGLYEYHLDVARRLVLVKAETRKRGERTKTMEETFAELEEQYENGEAHIPERLRRIIHEYRA